MCLDSGCGRARQGNKHMKERGLCIQKEPRCIDSQLYKHEETLLAARVKSLSYQFSQYMCTYGPPPLSLKPPTLAALVTCSFRCRNSCACPVHICHVSVCMSIYRRTDNMSIWIWIYIYINIHVSVRMPIDI